MDLDESGRKVSTVILSKAPPQEAGGEISWALPEDGSTVVPVWFGFQKGSGSQGVRFDAQCLGPLAGQLSRSHGKLSMLHIEPLPEDPAGLVEHFDVYIAKLPEGPKPKTLNPKPSEP